MGNARADANIHDMNFPECRHTLDSKGNDCRLALGFVQGSDFAVPMVFAIDCRDALCRSSGIEATIRTDTLR